MNMEALEKLASEKTEKTEQTEKQAAGELAKLAPWIGALAGSALGNTVAKSTEDEDDKSVWKWVRRVLGMAAGGAAGYFAGQQFGPESKWRGGAATGADAAGYLGDAGAATLGARGLGQTLKALFTQPTLKSMWNGGVPSASRELIPAVPLSLKDKLRGSLSGGVKGGLKNLGLGAAVEAGAYGLHSLADYIRNK